MADGVPDELRGIGQMARETGLTVSALRFYDRVGLLVPASVDRETGYRWYARRQLTPARLVAALRRVGMPLTGIAAVLASLPDVDAAHALVDAHLRRLEDGLADARRQLSRVHQLLDFPEGTMTHVTVDALDLAAALDAARFAVGTDPALPVLGGVLLAATPDGLEVVATDRFRLAVGYAPAELDGPSGQAVAPVGFVAQVRARLDSATGPARLTIGSDLTAEISGYRVTAPAVPGEFPDHRRLLGGSMGRRPVTVDVAALRAALAAELSHPVTVLAVQLGGGVGVVERSHWDAEDPGTVAVNPEFLLQALDAGGEGQLVLELDGPIRPLAIRTTGGRGHVSLLMPVRL